MIENLVHGMNSPEQSALKSHRIHTEYCNALRQLAQKMRPYAFLQDSMGALMEIADGEVQPFSVAVFGRMKTGKSSLINAMIGKRLAITGGEEATATINRLTYADGEQLHTFTAHWKDAPPESFPLDALQREWNGKTPEVLERVQRVSHLELYSNIPALRDIHIIDTPGTDSAAKEHEAVAQQFIKGQQTDALVYVFASVGRETDEDALASFRAGCLPESDPYNSVAIMHKWDETYWKNNGDMEDIRRKARRLHEQMHEAVAEVLPVSAPLALLAKSASPDFWNACLHELANYATEDVLLRSLSRDGKWDRSPSAAALRQRAATDYDLPWASFRVAMRHLYRHSAKAPEQAAALILELSGIAQFEKMLDERFFKRQAVIRQQQVRIRAQRVLDAGYYLIEDTLHKQEKDVNCLKRLYEVVAEPDLRQWVSSRLMLEDTQLRELRKSWNEIDSLAIRIREGRDRDKNTLDVEHWLDSVPSNYFSAEQVAMLKTLLSGRSTADVMPQMPELYRLVVALTQHPDAQTKQRAVQLKEIIIHTLQKKS